MKNKIIIGIVVILVVLGYWIYQSSAIWNAPKGKVDGGSINCDKVLALEEGTTQDWSICDARK